MEPSLLHKDPGQLPLHLGRELGWTSEFVHWKDHDFQPDLPPAYERWVKNVSVSVSPSRARHTLGFLDYVRRRAKQIDVLLAYHLTSESLFTLSTYKALNPRGVSVLKLDMDHRALVGFEPTPALSKRGVLMRLFAHAPLDLTLIESESMHAHLEPHLRRMGHRLRLFPNGVDDLPLTSPGALLEEKQNVVLTVGRLGAEQKNTELIVDAIERLPQAELGDWQFWFVGSRTPAFDARLAQLRSRRPDLAPRLVVRDFVSSREELAGLYRKARVFCLSSRWESFGIVLAEAAAHGCYLVSTRVGAAPELTGHGVHGQLVNEGDLSQLAAALRRVMTNELPTAASAQWAHRHVVQNFRWPHLARRFSGFIDEVRQSR